MTVSAADRGLFVTFEGIDGSGKTTQVERLKAFLEARGHEVVIQREPGGTPLGERVRELLLMGDELSPWTEACLFAAARAELVARVIKPALEAGRHVILDRYIDSSLAYQAYGRGLDVDEIRRWNLTIAQDLLPDRTFLLGYPAEDATKRLGSQLRLFAVGADSGPPDRMERESLEFRRTVEEAYRALANQEPERFVLVDGGQPKARVAKTVKAEIRRLLARRSACTAAA